MKKKEIRQLCEDCAAKDGKSIPPGHIASFWTDTCDVCGEFKELTAWNDYGYTKKEI